MLQQESQRETSVEEAAQIAHQTVMRQSPEISMIMDEQRFNHLWRVGQMYARSQIAPKHYRGHPEDCAIAAAMATRLGMDPLLFMMQTYVVHGRLGMSGQLAIALVNTSGLFDGSLRFEIEGEDPHNLNHRVRAWGIRRDTGERVNGSWIDWKLVKAEGWDKNKPLKDGRGEQISKWQTMPGQMFLYRAGAWFARSHCPERLMGMLTVEEIEDMGEMVDGPVKTERSINDLIKKSPAQREKQDAPLAPETTEQSFLSTDPPKAAPSACPLCGGPKRGRGYAHTDECSIKRRRKSAAPGEDADTRTRRIVWGRLVSMCGGDAEDERTVSGAKGLLEMFSARETETGELKDGVTDLDQIAGDALEDLAKKVEREYETWVEKQEE